MDRFIFRCLAVLVFLMAPKLAAQFTYHTNAGAIVLSGYSGSGGAVTIPNFVNSIAANAFTPSFSPNGHLLTSVAIPDNVTNIGASAFQGCSNLTSVALGHRIISLGNNAFTFCGKLTAIAIPAATTNIGIEPFYYCTNLTAITVDAQNPVFSSQNGVMFDKARTTLLQVPGGLAGSYTIPDGVTTVGAGALWNCINLTNVTISASVTSMPPGPLSGCAKLKTIVVDAQNRAFGSFAGVLFDKIQTTLIQYPEGQGGTYAIPGGVTTVGGLAFSFCNNLTNVFVPGTVTNLEYYAFEDCFSLVGVVFAGDAPASLGTYVFYYDTNTTAFYLPGTTGWDTFNAVPAVLWNPSIQTTNSNIGIQGNQFNFTITGTANIPISVQAADNLTGGPWTVLQTCTLTNGSIVFGDRTWTNYADRFYRIAFP